MANETNKDLRQLDSGHGDNLRRADTIGSISLTPEQFEQMYLGPQNRVHGDLRRTFGNPTPIGLGGFLLALTPLVCQFMGWRGTAQTSGLPTFGSYIFLGGTLAIIASILEFILGNSFPACFMGVYGGFFLTYGITVIPYYGAVATFAPQEMVAMYVQQGLTGTALDSALYMAGAESPEFNAAIGLFTAFVAVFTFFLLIASLRTNFIFVMAFATLTVSVAMYTTSKFYLADGLAARAMTYQIAAGATGFVTCMCGWYLLAAEILTTVDFPVNLPVFDLSRVVPGAHDRLKTRTYPETNGDKA